MSRSNHHRRKRAKSPSLSPSTNSSSSPPQKRSRSSTHGAHFRIKEQENQPKATDGHRSDVKDLWTKLRNIDPDVLRTVLKVVANQSHSASPVNDAIASRIGEDEAEDEMLPEVQMDEEEERRMEERANELAQRLAIPFRELQDSTKSNLNESLRMISDAIEAGIQPPQQQAFKHQYNTWEASETNLRRKGISLWTTFAKQVKASIATVEELSEKLAAGKAEKIRLVEQARQDVNVLLNKQAKEMDQYKKKIQASRKGLYPKMVQATDKQIREKDVHLHLNNSINKADGA